MRIGQGAQGIICLATDKQQPTPTSVAVKKMPNALDELVSCKRLVRELRLLRYLKQENILSLLDVMLPPSSNVLLWKDVYVVSPLLDTDLHYVITSSQPLSVRMRPARGRPCSRRTLSSGQVLSSQARD